VEGWVELVVEALGRFSEVVPVRRVLLARGALLLGVVLAIDLGISARVRGKGYYF
jgi:hypothetical protein